MTREHHQRETIDYVALHAKRKPRQKSRKNKVNNKQVVRARIAGDDQITTGRRTTFCHQGLRHSKTASPRDDDLVEDEDVSEFLESFSAFGVAKKFPTSASEPGITTQPLPPSSPGPDMLHEQAREAEAVIVDNTQATLAMSKPLAQVIWISPDGQGRRREQR